MFRKQWKYVCSMDGPYLLKNKNRNRNKYLGSIPTYYFRLSENILKYRSFVVIVRDRLEWLVSFSRNNLFYGMYLDFLDFCSFLAGAWMKHVDSRKYSHVFLHTLIFFSLFSPRIKRISEKFILLLLNHS